jgi:MFS transporter, putative metabolite:H+ symporter
MFGFDLDLVGLPAVTSGVGVIASITCALSIDKVGRKPWYSTAFLLATVPLLTLAWLGATSATEVLILATATYAVLQTIAFSLYLTFCRIWFISVLTWGRLFSSSDNNNQNPGADG